MLFRNKDVMKMCYSKLITTLTKKSIMNTEIQDFLVNHKILNFLEILEDYSPITLEEINKKNENAFPDFLKTIDELKKYGFILIDENEKIKLRNYGQEKLKILRVLIEKESIRSLYDVFKKEVFNRFELITKQNLTNIFFEEVNSAKRISSISSLSICSPWISLTEDQKNLLLDLKKIGTKIFIIMRPVEGTKSLSLETHNFFLTNGFSLLGYYKKRPLHTKLYLIRRRDGRHVVIFGSENLTNQKNEELGMLIKDESFFKVLNTYYLKLFGNSEPAIKN